MTKAIAGAHVELGLNTSPFDRAWGNVQKRMKRLGSQMQSVGRAMSFNISVPLALVGGAALKASADFEQGLSNMAAILRPTAREFDALRERAVELGKTTKFTARQAADGMEMLARNGLKAGQILGGAADATLNLAAAANADLAPAADVITDIMVNFNKEGADLKSVIDNIAGTLTNSKFDWEDYQMAVSQAAGAAGPLGMSFEDMNAALAATAPSFASGEEAGTSFKGFLLRLAPDGKEAQEMITKLGLSFFDAAGNLRSLAEIAEELRVKVGRLTKESQVEVLGALFGQRTIRTALRLMEEGAVGVERLTKAIGGVSAADMAAKRLDNFWGSVTLLKSALEAVGIAIGNSGLLSFARSLADGLAEIARDLATVNPALLRWGTVMVGLVAVLGPLILVMGLFATAIGAISLPITLTIAAIVLLAGTIAAFWPEVRQAAQMVSNAFRGIFQAAKQWLMDKLQPVIDWFMSVFRRIGGFFTAAYEKLGLSALVDGVRGAMSTVKEHVKSAASSVAEAWRAAGDQVEAEAPEIGDKLASPAKDAARKIKEAIKGSAVFGDDPAQGTAALTDLMFQHQSQQFEEGKALAESMRTPMEEYHAQLQRANELLQIGAIDQETYERAAERAAERAGLSWGNAGASIAGSFAEIADTFGEESKKMAKTAQILGATQALISTWVGAATALAGPFPENLAAAAAVLAKGLGLVAAIRAEPIPGFATGGSFRVGGVGGTDSQLVQFRATPGEMVDVKTPAQSASQMKKPTINVNGDAIDPRKYYRGSVLDAIVDNLNEYWRNGGHRLKAAR